jgi:murein endopeptidase
MVMCACSALNPPSADEEAALKRSDVKEVESAEPTPETRESRQVTYRIVRGGSLRQVANLYKLYHHEIIALNPDTDPDAQLAPNTELVVFRDTGKESESVGFPHDGRLVGAWPLPDGPGRKIMAERWKTWGSKSMIQQLDRVLTRWSDIEPQGPPVLVGNLSTRSGGPLDPHKSHQSGRDADLSYMAKWDGKSAVTWQHVTPETIDPELTWKLLRLLAKEAKVEAFFIDRSLQRVLLTHAQKTGSIRTARLAQWLEVASGNDEALIRHVPGHKDHFHVRFACPENANRCK